MTPFYELTLSPTPDQLRALRRLQAACGLVTLTCAQQAYLQTHDQDVALAALLGGADHADRSPQGEVDALTGISALDGVPPALLVNAVSGWQTTARGAGAASTVRVPVPLGGEDWLSGISAAGVHLRGVPGAVAYQPVSPQAPAWKALAVHASGQAWIDTAAPGWRLEVW